ncbi:hypothetical protein [Salinivibrio kushneri]|uniref:hypothetical protein n=1 Tax=Salinivibrio kushneri TaxID=1908198 RepID=UPI0022B46162|nr:hypothetical protein [Salinivibrio kushneri]WBA17122.1 hypothetical protein O4598_08175 [Salinivibrio kushneri]
MKKLYLHMGFHKTATSSFQATCKKNIDKLIDAGIVYPLFNSVQAKTKNIANHSIPFFSLYSGHAVNYHINVNWKVEDVSALNQDYKAEWQRCLSLGFNIIISGEDISYLNENALKELKNVIEYYDYDIIPIAVVRSPYEFSCSASQQMIMGGSQASVTAFHSQIGKINRIKSVFPKTEFIPFKQSCEHELGPVGFLLDKVGVNPEDFIIFDTNEGVSNALVRAQATINRDTSRIVDGRSNDNWRSLRNKDAGCFNSKFLLTEEEFETIREDIEKENQWFNDILGEAFTDKSIKFSDSSTVYDELATYLLTPEDLKDKDADSLRDAAIQLEHTDMNLALNLMKLASKARPHGPFIKRKLAYYRKVLSEKTTEHNDE